MFGGKHKNAFRTFVNSKFWRGAVMREAFKFSIYIFFPIAGSVVYANPAAMKVFLEMFQFVKYSKQDDFDFEAEKNKQMLKLEAMLDANNSNDSSSNNSRNNRSN